MEVGTPVRGIRLDGYALTSLDERLKTAEVVLHSLSEFEEFCQEILNHEKRMRNSLARSSTPRGQGSEGTAEALALNWNL